MPERDNEATRGPAQRQAKHMRKLRKRLWRVRSRLGRRKRVRESRERMRERDPEDNARLALPEGEQVLWPLLWVTEIYGPSHIPRLRSAITALDLDTDPTHIGRYLGELLEGGRTGYGGWSRAGEYTPKDRFLPGLGAISADLPDSFERASPVFFGVSNGITVSVTTFRLSQSAAKSLDVLMRKEYASVVRLPREEHVDAEFVKEEAIGTKRLEIRGQAEAWVQRHFPGAFGEGLAKRFPCWDLLLTENEPLFDDGPGPPGWRRPLGFGFTPLRWASEDLPGLTLCDPEPFTRRDQAIKAFVGRRSQVIALDPGYNGPPELGGAIHRLEEDLAPLMIISSLQLGLLAHERRFGELRDALTAKRPIWTLGLKDLKTTVLPSSLDLRALAKAGTNETARSYLIREAPTFRDEDVLMKIRGRDPSHQEFFDAMSSRIEETAAAAIDEMDQIVAATRNIADVVVARTNLRLQVAVLVLSVAVIALTVVQLVVALND
jgi:hypothetical protein